jgi:hypothetical protein
MFEYHGWAVVRSESEADDADAALIQELQSKVASLSEFTRRTFHIGEPLNGMYAVRVSGLRNHSRPEIIDLFRWLADRSRGSYGLLYVHDDEDREHECVFQVFRLAQGELVEFDDPFLSPIVSTIEDAYGETGDE